MASLIPNICFTIFLPTIITATQTLISLIVVPFKELRSFAQGTAIALPSFSGGIGLYILGAHAIELYLLAFKPCLLPYSWLLYIPLTLRHIIVAKRGAKSFQEATDKFSALMMASLLFEFISALLLGYAGNLFVPPQLMEILQSCWSTRFLRSMDIVIFIRFYKVYWRSFRRFIAYLFAKAGAIQPALPAAPPRPHGYPLYKGTNREAERLREAFRQ